MKGGSILILLQDHSLTNSTWRQKRLPCQLFGWSRELTLTLFAQYYHRLWGKSAIGE
jgi:hypothetical protein